MSTFVPIEPKEIAWINGIPMSTTAGTFDGYQEICLEDSLNGYVHGNALLKRWEQLNHQQRKSFIIGELGFGCGLNFLLVWSLWEQFAPPDAQLQFYACEKYPLVRSDLAKYLSQWPSLSHYAQQLLDHYPVLTPGFHCLSFYQGRVSLILMLGNAVDNFQQLLHCAETTLEHQLRAASVNAWFLNNFAQSRNPQILHDELLLILSQLSSAGTTFSSYLVDDRLKNGLISAGFEVESQLGFGQKKKMLVGKWRNPVPMKGRRYTPWHIGKASQSRVKRQHAIVVGAGLAGCSLSYALAKRGWQVTLLDENNHVGSGASGNHRALLFPNLSAYRAPLTELMLMAFLYAHQFYRECLQKWPVGELSGILQLLDQKKSPTTHHALLQWLKSYPALGKFMDASEASELAGISVLTDSIFIPLAGWLDSPLLCQHLINHPAIEWVSDTKIHQLICHENGWYIGDHTAEVVILANGFGVNRFSQSQYLPLRLVHGQTTTLNSSPQSESLRIPLCAEVHIVPAYEGKHDIGATFRLNPVENACYAVNDLKNISGLNQMPVQLGLTNDIVENWSGIRAASLDHLPIVGPCANAEAFKQRFKGIASNSKRWIASAGDTHEGLYVFSGFGSRGLTTIPLCSEYLASLINQNMSCLPRSLIQAISPARFLIRSLCRGEKSLPK